jgi:hypothetical protein
MQLTIVLTKMGYIKIDPIKFHHNERCPCMPSDFTRLWVNSIVIMNGLSGEGMNSLV